MKAVYLTGHGGNEVVAVGERPEPERQPGEVLVRMHAATLNRVDRAITACTSVKKCWSTPPWCAAPASFAKVAKRCCAPA
jgi:NADPH:quinone reductase-like Zn-dependent oxidoreductase